MPFTVRPGGAADLEACASVWLATIDPALRSPAPVYPLHRHELATGDLVVAERNGQVIGFGGALTRPGRWFLADLFVDPATQAHGVGRALFDRLVARAGPELVRVTMASDDPRARALYARAGMVPRWPALHLAARATPLGLVRPAGWSVDPVDVGNLLSLVGAAGHQLDPVDLAYWTTTLDTDLLMVAGPEAGGPTPGVRAGLVVRRNNPFVLADPGAVTFGPVVMAGTDPAGRPVPVTPDEARAVCGAALWWLRQQGRVGDDGPLVRFLVPGPHPGLVPLLDAGFHIVDSDLYCAASPDLVDPGITCPSQDLL